MENRTLSPLGLGCVVRGCGRHRHVRGSATKAGVEPVGLAVDSIQSIECEPFKVRAEPIVGFPLKRIAIDFTQRAVVVHAQFIQSARFATADERAFGGQKRRLVVRIHKTQSGVSAAEPFCDAVNLAVLHDPIYKRQTLVARQKQWRFFIAFQWQLKRQRD